MRISYLIVLKSVRVNFSISVQLLGRRHAEVVDPHAFVEADRIDDQRVAFPAADRVSAVGRRQVGRMWPAVVENRPEAVGAAGLEDEQALVLTIVDELRAIGGGDLTRAARGFAAHVRFVADLDAVGEQRPGPGLKRNLTELRLGGEERIGRVPHVSGKQPEVFGLVGAGQRHDLAPPSQSPVPPPSTCPRLT